MNAQHNTDKSFTLKPLPIKELPLPPKDVELLAQYFYKYKYQLDPTLKCEVQDSGSPTYFARIPMDYVHFLF